MVPFKNDFDQEFSVKAFVKPILVGVIFVVLIVMVEIIQDIGFWGMESREVATPIVGLELEVETPCNLQEFLLAVMVVMNWEGVGKGKERWRWKSYCFFEPLPLYNQKFVAFACPICTYTCW